MLRAGIALHTGSRDVALRELALAAEQFESAGTMGYAMALRDRLARLRGDARSRLEVERTARWLRQEGVVAPERFIEVLTPGFRTARAARWA